jgi:hypothetical protein
MTVSRKFKSFVMHSLNFVQRAGDAAGSASHLDSPPQVIGGLVDNWDAHNPGTYIPFVYALVE